MQLCTPVEKFTSIWQQTWSIWSFNATSTPTKTLAATAEFERMCLGTGVIPQEYLSDNGSAFTSREYMAHLRLYSQISWFAGVGTHHHNGLAERAIQTIMSIARTMLLHAAIHWHDMADPSLWPMAVQHAVFLHNHVPSPSTGLCPHDLFFKTQWSQAKFHDLHMWGCPVYVLDKTLSDRSTNSPPSVPMKTPCPTSTPTCGPSSLVKVSSSLSSMTNLRSMLLTSQTKKIPTPLPITTIDAQPSWQHMIRSLPSFHYQFRPPPPPTPSLPPSTTPHGPPSVAPPPAPPSPSQREIPSQSQRVPIFSPIPTPSPRVTPPVSSTPTFSPSLSPSPLNPSILLFPRRHLPFRPSLSLPPYLLFRGSLRPLLPVVPSVLPRPWPG